MSATSEPPAAGALNDFEQLPYESKPYAYTQPENLAALALLYGLEPPPVSHARVLELGCAMGGNLLPMAARRPECHFVGVDLSERHVDIARARAVRPGLSNCEIRLADFSTASFGEERFDYIIGHGLLSWTPPAAQDALFRVCSDLLSPTGMAVMSYNVLPGWHLRNAVRDICLASAEGETSPLKRVEKALAGLKALSEPGRGHYSAYLRVEAERLSAQDPSYLHSEYLSEWNYPWSFPRFLSKLATVNLQYLCEGEISTTIPEYVYPNFAPAVRAMAGADALKAQVTLDRMTGRTFRRSVIVRAGRNPRACDQFDRSALKALHFTSGVVHLPNESKAGQQVFRDPIGRNVVLPNGSEAEMLMRMLKVFPSSLSYHDLTSGLQFAGDDQALDQVINVTMRGLASLSSVPIQFAISVGDRPKIWNIARFEAERGQSWATGQHHQTVTLPPPLGSLMVSMDGTRHQEDLKNVLLEINRTGQGGIPVLNEAQAKSMLAQMLEYLRRSALLA